MLSSIRKFSSSIYSKIFLVIVAIPFIFWGMGPVFQTGKLNTIAEIGKEKYSTEEFTNFVKANANYDELLDKNLIETLLSNFIGEKLIQLESENLEIKVSDNSLSSIIKNEKIFQKGNKFSRTEYEKFLIKNSMNAASFESNILMQAKKQQFFNFIGGGVVPSKFLVSMDFDKINQKRNIQLIDLNEVVKKITNIQHDEIESFFNKNKDSFSEIFKSVKLVKLLPRNLTGDDDFNDLFFQKIDEIDDLIIEGKNIKFLTQRYNLENIIKITFDKFGKNKNSKPVDSLPVDLIKNIFNIEQTYPTTLAEHKGEYYLIELVDTEKIQKKVTDDSVKKEIVLNLESDAKRKFVSKIISEITKNNFKKSDFEKLSKEKNIPIKKIKLNSQNDESILKKNLIEQIYKYPEKRVIVVADIGLTNNFLVYIDNIEKVEVKNNSEDFKKYFYLTRGKIKNDLFNTFDNYLKNKYKIKINYKALDSVKNYFR